LALWHAMTGVEKAEASEGPWTLLGRLYYLDPVESQGVAWSGWWWDAGSDEPGKGWFDVATTGWPFGTSPSTGCSKPAVMWTRIAAFEAQGVAVSPAVHGSR